VNKNKLAHHAAVAVLCVLLAAMPLSGTAQAFGEGARGPDVYAVQGMLKSLGFYAGRIDGVYGPVMKAGVSHFQRTYGLPVTGAVDAKTLQSILWAYAELKIPKSPETPKTPTPAPTPQVPDKGKEVPGLSAEELRMIELVNAERAKIGLPALAADAELSRVARIKSQDMIANNYFSHTSPTYGSPFEMMRNFGISFRAAGENLACNASVEAAHNALMQSQGHRENIMNSSFQRIGVGIVDGGICGKMFTQLFIGN